MKSGKPAASEARMQELSAIAEAATGRYASTKKVNVAEKARIVPIPKKTEATCVESSAVSRPREVTLTYERNGVGDIRIRREGEYE